MQAILQYRWKTGEPQQFCVTCKPEPDKKATIYSGFFKINDEWISVAAFRAPNDGEYMKGLYSFLENFGRNKLEERQCLYGNQMIKFQGDAHWTKKSDVRCTTTKAKDDYDYFNFCTEDKCFSMTINGPKLKEGCETCKPDKMELS